MSASIDELTVADPPATWEAAGFALEGDCCVVGTVRIRLAGARPGKGILAWSLRGIASTELEGLPTERSERPPPAASPDHPNGVLGVDHVVAFTPRLDRTVAAFERAGLDLRRIREEPTPAGAPRQAFFRLGTAILEVVEQPEAAIGPDEADRAAFFWGLAFSVTDLDAALALLGERAGAPRPAVQPGRRIATLRRSAGLSVPVALMSPKAA
jgi:hypothetical protein